MLMTRSLASRKIAAAQDGHIGGSVAKVTVKHVEHGSYNRAMASGITLAGPSPDGFVHVQFWREALRMTEEHFDQELLQEGDMQVAKMVPAGNSSEQFREDVATMMIPVQKFPEFCDAMCKMRDVLAQAIAVRDAAIARDTAG